MTIVCGEPGEDRSRKVLRRPPKEERVASVMYVYIVFKHCATAETTLDVFQYDVPLKDFFK